jgi:transcriptional regulator with XRE-family HTH domain
VTVRTNRTVRQKPKGPIDPGFGRRVHQLRAQRGLTQQQLAGGDFTKAFISHIEHGRTRVSLRAAEIFAGRLGVDVRELMAPQGGGDARAELALVVAEAHIARRAYDDALRAARAIGSGLADRYRARARRVEGLALLETGRARQAIAPLRDAVRTFSALGLADLAARATYDLGYAHASLDEPGEAASLLVECERALTTGDVVDKTLELKVHSLLAGVFARTGDYASADLQAERATRLADDVVDERALDTLYASLIATRRAQGDLEGALTYARKALQLHERHGRESEAFHAWNNLAWIHIERGQYTRAEDALAKAERLRKERHVGELGQLRVTRAKLELERGRPARALELAAEAADDPNLRVWARAQALFIGARATDANRASTARVREAFDRALRVFADQPARKRAAVHEAYAEALAARGMSAAAYREAQEALRLQKA